MAANRNPFGKPSIIITDKGTAIYPHLSHPDTKFDPDGHYKVSLRLSGESAEALMGIIETARNEAVAALKAAAKASGNLKEIKKYDKMADLPIKPVLNEAGEETGEFDFSFKMRAKGKRKTGEEYTQKPVVVDAANKPLAEEVWGGSTIQVNAAVAPFFVPALGVGVSMRLRGVRVLELRTGGSSAESMFGDPTDGYRAEGEKGDDGEKENVDFED